MSSSSAHLSHKNLLARAGVAYAQSLAYYSSGDIVAALQRIREATEFAQAAYLGYTILMRIYLACKEMDAARLAFRKAEEALQKTYSLYRRDAYLITHWTSSGWQMESRNAL